MTASIADKLRAAAEVSRMLEPDHAALLATAANEIESLRRRVDEQSQRMTKMQHEFEAAKRQRMPQRRSGWGR
jgi:hypothetical protein